MNELAMVMERRLTISRTLILAALAIALCFPLTAARLTARVQGPAGEPVPALVVLIKNLDTGEQVEVRTDDEGVFSVELGGGEYSLVPVSPSGLEQDQTLRLTLAPDSDQQLELEFIEDNAQARGWLAVSQSEEPTVAARPETESELVVIRDFDLMLTRLPFKRRAQAESPLEDLINPFQASRRGVFHGSLYEFHRNDNLDARNFFDPAGEPLPEYKRNQFGASAVASLTPSFQIMGSYDGLRIIQGSTLLSHVPTSRMKQGDFSELLQLADPIQLKDPLTGDLWTDNRFPVARIHPISAKLLELLPDPNRSDPDRNFVNNQPVLHNQNAVTFKLDYQYAGAKISSDYNFSESEIARPGSLPAFSTQEETRQQDMRVGLAYNFTHRLLLDSQFRFVRTRMERLSQNAGRAGLLESIGIAGLSVSDILDEGYPAFYLSGYTSFGDPASPVSSVFNGFFTDVTLTYARDSHTVRWGAEVDFRQYNNHRSGGSHRGTFGFNGLFSGDAFADFLFGLPETASRAVGVDRSDLRGADLEFFAEDTWKISPRWTVWSSLTYSYFPPYNAVHDNISGFAPLLLDPPLTGQLVIAGSDAARRLGLPDSPYSMVFSDKNNFSPRIGLAYNPFLSNRLIVRSSYGIGYEAAAAGHYLSYLGHNFPFYYVESVQSPAGFPTIDLASPFDALAPVELNVRGIDPRLRNPYYQDWHLSLEAELFKHWRFDAGYYGGNGKRLYRVLPANVPLPGPGDLQPRRPNPAFGRFTMVTNSGNYSRHAVSFNAQRRFSGGLSIDAGLSWTRAFADTFSGAPNNLRNLRAEWAPVGYQPNRRLSLRYILDLPFGTGRLLANNLENSWLRQIVSGWRLTGITSIQDGTPFTVYLAGDLNNDGLGNERPDRIGPGYLPPAERSIDRWFVIEDFREPLPYSFGNSGQNILMGPSYQNWDVSLIKQTRRSDGKVIELRVELFNAFNHVNFYHPERVLGNSTFGKIFGAGRSREIEVALKFTF
ncbi:MAG TPA: hypothetical protein PLP42_00215 [Acidobacteriota bacterium]|nr:hypothetical protein [Acidobacteriota bacterium]